MSTSQNAPPPNPDAPSSKSVDNDFDEKPEAIRLYIPRELYLIPLTTTSMGMALGFLRGSRKASLRYLAENAHRAPKTLEEWYFYHKTKNYRVLSGGLKQSGRESLRFGAAGLFWVGAEQAASRVGLGAYKEVLAGVGLGGLVAAAYRLPRRATMQVGLLGIMGGSVMALLRRTQDVIGQRIGSEDGPAASTSGERETVVSAGS
ncbi:hypothetical protein DL93DRAFT_2083589 [Clavulina sp. PMI_390]|nr:hypothetical protein DL93DRAFT_2083589 [Clavulina sp. PMI_390]